MAALTNVYVDPSINANSGTGTSGDPYGDLQYALNTMTRDGTNGDQINVKAGTAETLSAVLSFATYIAVTSPTGVAPLVIRGYTSSANDGGIAIIDGNGGACVPALANIHLRDLHFRNGGSSTLVDVAASSVIINCKVEDTSGTGIALTGAYAGAFGNEVTDCGVGISMSGTSNRVYMNYLKFGGTRNFTNAISLTGTAVQVGRNIISAGTSGNGISVGAARPMIEGNSIFANGSTGSGVVFDAAARGQEAAIINNVVEGFSGVTTGSGFSFATATSVPLRYAGNAAYNNTENYRNAGDIGIADNVDNEALGASPFAKSGSDTFANRFVYFAPADTGNIRGGAIQ